MENYFRDAFLKEMIADKSASISMMDACGNPYRIVVYDEDGGFVAYVPHQTRYVKERFNSPAEAFEFYDNS